MNKKRAIATITACGLVAAMALGGSLAYLTDNESHTNTVQVSGNVRVDLVEPKWDETDDDNNGVPDPAQDAVPNQEIKKDPKVVNTGENPCFVFMRVTVPVKDITRVRDDGTLVQKNNNVNPLRTGPNGEKIYHQPQDVFYFKQTNDAEGMHANNFNPKWKRLKNREFNVEVVANADGTASTTYGDQVVGQAVYVFGYEDELPPVGDGSDTTGYTTTLFDKIQIKNIVENELTADQIQNIKLETFAIQSDNLIIGATETSTGTKWTKKAGLTAAELQDIYDIFVKQNGKIDSGNNDGTKGNMEWNTYQDNQHGQSEKEADISNERNLIDNKNASNVTSFLNNSIHGRPVDGQNHNGTDLLVGQSGRLEFTTRTTRPGATSAKGEFSSSNPEVVEIDAQSGVYTAKKKGDATLTVTVDGVKASIQVTVMNDSRNPDANAAVPVNNDSNIPNGTTEPVPNVPQP